MTKEAYFEMCEALNSEPLEEEIPVEINDFPYFVQKVFQLYEALRDDWDYMVGNYIGKNITNLFEVFDLFEVEKEERLITYQLLNVIDRERRAIIRSKNTNKPST